MAVKGDSNTYIVGWVPQCLGKLAQGGGWAEVENS